MPVGHTFPPRDERGKDLVTVEPRAAPSPVADHVIGVFAREVLSPALAATHRAGFGPQTRVIDSARGDPGQQLERMGLRVPWGEPPSAEAVLIVVTAPGRTVNVADLFARLGADSVSFAERRSAGRPATEPIVSPAPDLRIGDGAGASSEA
jgi:hypothetical protein